MMSKKLFGLKKGMRAIALGLAAVLTVGSLNVMNVEAAGVDGLSYPKYDTTESSPTYGTYIYNTNDIFGAATHVHLFGESVTTTGVHTHGNIMANEAWIGNSGMNEGKISYPLDYREVSYVANAIHQIDSNITGDLVIGPNITYNLVEQSANITKISFDGKLVEIKRGNIYKDTDTVKAVDIATELSNLATLSANWAAEGAAHGTTITDLSNHTIETNQNENPTSNIYINIPYSVWDANGDTLKITELDSNVNNRGIVVINIDAHGYDSIDLTCIGAGIMAVDSAQNVYSNSEHTTAAFGSCRIVYNIVDNGQPYEGTVEFMNTVFGSILAPKATVKVGAVNGTVMAKNITHTGQESHRMDIWPIFTDSTSVIEYDEIRLMLTYKDNGSEVNVGDKSQTEYTLCTYDPATGTYSPVDKDDARFTNIEAVWNKDAEKYEVIISSEDVTKEIKDSNGKLDVNTPYYLVKGAIHPEYQDNDTVFKAVIGTDGTVEYEQCKETGAAGEGNPTTTVFTDVLEKKTVPANDKIVINVEFSGPVAGEPTDADGGSVKYQVYSDPDCKTEVTGVEVSISKDTEGNWKAEFGTDLTKGLDKNTEYYIAVSNNDSKFKDVSEDVYKVKFDNDGTTLYYDQDKNAYDKDAIPTDKLIKNEGLALDVVFEGTQPDGTDSKVTYDVYKEDGTKVTTTPVEAKNTDDDKAFELVVDSEFTTENMDRNTPYYIEITNNGNDSHDDKSKDQYWVKFDDNGNAKYSTDKNAPDSEWKDGPLEDLLIPASGQTQPTITNDKVELNVEFSGPDGTTPNDNSGVKYEIYEECDANGNVSKPVTGSTTEAVKTDNGWKVEFNEDITKDLAQDKDYYVKVSTNGSDYKDVSEDVYKVKFDPTTGETQYYDPATGSYTTTVPTDTLIKNEGLALDVVFEGTQPEGTDSKVTYDVYKEDGTKVTTTPVEAKNTDDDKAFELVVDSEFTTENMDRNTPYYIEITNNGNDSHDDKSQDKYWVKFDDNGNAKYSTDKNAPDSEWKDGPLEDLLIPASGQTQPTITNDKVELNVEFSGPTGTTPSDNSGVKYEIYEECDTNGNVSKPVTGSTTEAVKTDDGWKVEFNEDITKDLAQDKDYYVKVSTNGSDYKDVSEDVYKVKFDPATGETQYYDPATGSYTTTVPTDKLIKNEGLALDVVFEGEQPEGTDSKVTYDVYKEDGTKVTTTPIEATDSNNDDVYEMVVDSEFTTENMDRNTPYYIEITNNGNDNHIDASQDKYWVKFDDNGNAKYSTDKDAPADQWVDGPLEDILISSSTSPSQPYVPNDKIELNVEFSGPDGTNPADNSGVKYEIYEECDTNGNVSKPVTGSTTEAVKTGNGWKVEFDENITDTLAKDKDYYVKVSTNGSDYKDVSEDVYKVKFDPTTGETQYYDPATGSYTTTVPTDKLIKNEGLELDVVFKGDQPTGTDSDVTYDVYDKDGNKVTKEPIKATDTDGDKNYEVVVDSSFTTDKLDRDKIYYIGISDNKSNYTDESKDKYWVKFDGNGNVSYSKDGNTWQDTPMQDVLVKETSGSTSGTGNSGSNNSGSSNSGSSNTGSTGSTNTGSVTTAGSNVVTSPKTGEDNTVFLFMGLAVVSAIAAGACAYRKRRA